MDNKIYQYLCKLFGSPKVVRLRRTIYAAAEILNDNKLHRLIPSGSRCEGLEIPGSDFDIMLLDKRVSVYETSLDKYRENNMLSVSMDYSETKLGFTRLKLPYIYTVPDCARNAYQSMMYYSVNVGSECYFSSMLVRENTWQEGFTSHGPCQVALQGKDFDVEFLYCYRCKQWISLAKPWTTRIRKSWPSQQLIDDITQYGVLVVPVGFKTSKFEQIEWRISFSIAEKQLIHSFSHTQLLCYAMLKIVVSDIIKKQHGELLCSYFVKTIMFWLSEEIAAHFWTPANIVNCLMTCLQRLVYCVENKDCRHYFIPEINFFEERFDETNHKALLSSLHHVYNKGFRALIETDTFRKFDSALSRYHNLTSSVIAPILFIRGLPEDALPDLSRLLNICIGHQHATSKASKRVLLYAMEQCCLKRIIFKAYFIYHVGNKHIYRQLKSLLPQILLSTRTDCASGWCYLTSLFYKLKLYMMCKYIVDYLLTKYTQEKIFWTMYTHIVLPVHIQNIVCYSRWFPAVLRHCVNGNIWFHSQYLLPVELSNIWEGSNRLDIPPVVYMVFLKFVCAHHLKLEREKKIVFRELHRIVRDKVYIVGDNAMLVAGQIISVAERLLH